MFPRLNAQIFRIYYINYRSAVIHMYCRVSRLCLLEFFIHAQFTAPTMSIFSRAPARRCLNSFSAQTSFLHIFAGLLALCVCIIFNLRSSEILCGSKITVRWPFKFLIFNSFLHLSFLPCAVQAVRHGPASPHPASSSSLSAAEAPILSGFIYIYITDSTT